MFAQSTILGYPFDPTTPELFQSALELPASQGLRKRALQETTSDSVSILKTLEQTYREAIKECNAKQKNPLPSIISYSSDALKATLQTFAQTLANRFQHDQKKLNKLEQCLSFKHMLETTKNRARQNRNIDIMDFSRFIGEETMNNFLQLHTEGDIGISVRANRTLIQSEFAQRLARISTLGLPLDKIPVVNVTISSAYSAFEDPTRFKDTIAICYVMSGTLKTLNPFLFACQFYKDKITEDNFPFLNIPAVHALLNHYEGAYQARLDIVSSAWVLQTQASSSSCHRVIEAMLQLSTDLAGFPKPASLAEDFNENLSYTKKAAQTRPVLAKLVDSIPKITPPSSLSHQFVSQVSLALNTLDAIHKLAAIEIKTKDPLELINRQKETLTEEASELSKDALNNLARLTDIKSEIDQLTEQEAEILKRPHPVSEKVEALNEIVNGINSTAVLTAQLETSQPTPDDSAVRMAELQSALDDSQRKISSLVSQLNFIPTKAEQPANNALTLDLLAELTSKPSVRTVFDQIIKINDGNAVLSPSVLKDISNIKHFSNFDSLIRKLGTLTSNQFIETYTTKGSQACFSLLTSKEISFQESATVRSQKTRIFSFADGIKRDCKAHLRISTDKTEQNQLRIYFTIEDNKVFIGCVDRHLETAKTN